MSHYPIEAGSSNVHCSPLVLIETIVNGSSGCLTGKNWIELKAGKVIMRDEPVDPFYLAGGLGGCVRAAEYGESSVLNKLPAHTLCSALLC